MSALDPTKDEMKDIVGVFLPRVIVEAMSDIDGSFYNGDITDSALRLALGEEIDGFNVDNEKISIDIPLYVAKEISEWKDCYAPLIREVAKSCYDAMYINKITKD